MTRLLRIVQRIIIFIVRPYVVRELPGWGRLYKAVVGDYRRDWLWRMAPTIEIRGKLNGYLMQLDLSRWSDRVSYFLGRWYALDIQLFIADVVRLGDFVVDVGANRGMFTLLASRLVGQSGRVICFEPNPNCYKLLERELAANDIENVKIFHCGLADQSGELTLSVPMINSGEGTFGQSAYKRELTQEVRAKVCRGDDILTHEQPTLIKIDVEGFECKAIIGLQQVLARYQPLLITEVVPEHLAACHSSVDELKDLMEGLGYVAFVLSLRKKRWRYDWCLQELGTSEAGSDWVWIPPSAWAKHRLLFKEHVLAQSGCEVPKSIKNVIEGHGE